MDNMNITKQQLKQIIKEELKEYYWKPPEGPGTPLPLEQRPNDW